jgi:hypothetical protein
VSRDVVKMKIDIPSRPNRPETSTTNAALITARGPVPGSNQLEMNGTPVKRRDNQVNGDGRILRVASFPSGDGVERHRRIPVARLRLESMEIQTGLRQQRRPIDTG